MLRSLPSGEERRDLSLGDAGVNVVDNTDTAKRFTGHAAVFNTRAAIGNPLKWGFYEQIAPGAFSRTINGGDIRMLIDHDSSQIVSRTTAGTLGLVQDQRGLAVDSALDTGLSYVNDLVRNLENKNITGMSFGFQVKDDDWAIEDARNADGSAVTDLNGDPVQVEVRTIKEVKLFEVSSVTFPAYSETDAGLRYSLIPALRSRGDEEAIARVVRHHPEWAPMLGYEPSTTTSIYLDGKALAAQLDVEERGAIAYKKTATSDSAWDAATQEKNLGTDPTSAQLKGCYAWGSGDTKSGYKFPHHFVSSGGEVGAASTVACSAGIAALNGGRGGTSIPSGDRSGVYAHLAHHLKDAGKTPPELKSDPGPAETTQDDDFTDVAIDDSGSGESTRNAPSQQELAKAHLRYLDARRKQLLAS